VRYGKRDGHGRGECGGYRVSGPTSENERDRAAWKAFYGNGYDVIRRNAATGVLLWRVRINVRAGSAVNSFWILGGGVLKSYFGREKRATVTEEEVTAGRRLASTGRKKRKRRLGGLRATPKEL